MRRSQQLFAEETGRRVVTPSLSGHLLLVLYLAYVGLLSSLIYLLTDPVDSLYSLGFGFGPKIRGIAEGTSLGDASRMPFIPYFIGAIARIQDNYLVALALKNLIFQLPMAYVLVEMWEMSSRRALLIAITLYILTFPQLTRHSFALVPEEGYLIPLVAFLFFGFIVAKPSIPLQQIVPSAAINALTYLVKASAMLVGPAFCLLYFWRTRRRDLFAWFSGLFAAAVVGWGLMSLANTGEFAVTSSLNGYDFWKGNNERTIEYFPYRTLDAIGDLAPTRAPGQSEWAWNRECIRQGINFNLEHPGTAAAILGLRFYQVFLSVTAEESPSSYPIRPLLKPLGVLYMIVFRIAFLVSLGHAANIIFKLARERDRSQVDRSSFEVAVGYLVFVATFVAPYLVAWGTERRLMPLVIPTLLYLWSVAERQPQPLRPFPKRGGIVTNQLIDKLREDDAY